MTDDKRARAIEAALSVFVRYGYRRVTMGEIAAEAGMSRPALYLLFANKEEVFRAVIAELNRTALADVREAVAAQSDTGARLRAALECWTVRAWELIQSSPDAHALVESALDFARADIAAGNAAFEALLTDVFAPHAASLATHALTPSAVARVVAHAAKGIKAGAVDRADLVQQLDTLVRMVALTCEPVSASLTD